MIQKLNNELLDFKWRTRTGELIRPKDMETSHLFNTLKMIWNHTMPRKFEPYIKYGFDPSYSREYMELAVHHIGIELFTRKLTPEQLWILEEMASYFHMHMAERGHVFDLDQSLERSYLDHKM